MEATPSSTTEYPADYVFSKEDCRVCAIMLGIDPNTEQHLLWLARNFMSDHLNREWTFIQEHNHFHNKKTGELAWENPLKALYSYRVVEMRENRHLDLLAVDMIIPTDPPNDSKDCDTTSSDVVPQSEVMEEQEAEGYTWVVKDPVIKRLFEKIEEEERKFLGDLKYSDNYNRRIMEENKNKFYGEMEEEKNRFNGEMEEKKNRPRGEMEEEENRLQRTMEEKEKMLLEEMEEKENGLQREMTEKINTLHLEIKYQKNMFQREIEEKRNRLHIEIQEDLMEIYGDMEWQKSLIFAGMYDHKWLLRDTKENMMRLHGEMEEKKNMLHGEMERTPPQNNTLPIPN